ncbi:hypothetical protein R3W88_031704 [Solanum pinnatisectum]|uniref:CCHC-type domain-containing protein n=1 Tax=Solanum pinnatisectum TaxID=50273 RepID=A0AAV9LM54_9SOLN|nr:hypothetical protein R3W88_031704 [Solanum pinnatisectum]
MNPPSFNGSSTSEDPENFVDEMKMVFDMMHIADTERVELAAYQLKYVARIWFDQWKGGRAEDALPTSWACFEEAFLGCYFPRELKEAKGNVAQRGSKPPACTKCGRNHSSTCREGFTGCFKCGQNGHFIREFSKNRYGNGNGGSKAQYSSVAPPDRIAPRGDTFGTGGGTNRLYAINSRQEQADSLDVVNGMI